MVRHQWLSAFPLVVMAALAVPGLEAAEIRDRAGMFSPEAVKKDQATLDRIEQRTKIPVLIETIESISQLDRNVSKTDPRRAIDELADERFNEARNAGVYLLISSRDRLFSHVLVREKYAARLPRDTRLAIRNAMVEQFKKGRFDAGLASAVEILDDSLTAAPAAGRRAPVPAPPGAGRANVHGARFGVGTLLMIGLAILAVLVVLRILGGLFNRSSGGYPAQMGMGGMPRPGMGPGPGGYGPPGYGYGGAPRGGGFFSGMLGGLGGALAGNWLYDQFSGRHGPAGHTDASSYPPAASPESYDPGGDAPVGADDDAGLGASWDDPGGADAGGDWGGGDGGADWGGGGGDWGGGGDGGGDW
jgi:uncharacterized protein